MLTRRTLLHAILWTSLALPHLGAQNAPAKRGLFWKAASGEGTVYLLGSIHLGSKEMYPLAPEIEEAFAASSSLIVEADLNHIDMAKMQTMLLSKGMYGADDSLWKHVSEDTRKKVEALCEKYGMPAMMVGQMKPWLAAITVSTLPMMKEGMDPSLGIDKHFLDAAGNKSVVEIESADWQMDLLTGFSPSVQAAFLESAIKQANEAVEHGKRIRELWLAGDIAGIEKTLHDEDGPPEIEKALLHDRNPRMADVAERFLRTKGNAFLVVGAAHMVGPDGIVKLLEKRGFKVERVALSK